MKSLRVLEVLVFLIIVSLFSNSCTTPKKTAVACPEYHKGTNYSHPKNHAKNYAFNSVSSKKRIQHSHISGTHNFLSLNKKSKSQIRNKEQQEVFSTIRLIAEVKANDIYSQPVSANDLPSALNYNSNPSDISDLGSASLEKQIKSKAWRKENSSISEMQDGCDLMTLMSGEELNVKIIEIGLDVIKYKKCENLEGPVISIRKSDVLMIKYSNGTKDIIASPNNNPYTQVTPYVDLPAKKKTEPLSVVSFISGLTGLLIAAIILGPIALILGSVSLSKINKEPEIYKGKGLAIAGITIGAIDIIAILILLSMM
ncbi:MAG: DUF4190 domain-containing protein [Bacteroidales bacterium]|nr:DUF4190 domain-containing protein [Bacteroidales bacterium]MCB8998609.1 DUF4190 domain-containing protein [Bacteroidales bacterium]MCB9012523.1 DUF4190 domain-containing protein [Bacteroidales bacterium]